MSTVLWLHAWGVGFGLVSAIPAGPGTVLIIQRTLRAGRLHGFAALSGVMLGEALYIAAFVLGARAFFARAIVRDVLCGAGALMLIAVALHALRGGGRAGGARDGEPPMHGGSAWTAIRETFVVTLTNPAILLVMGALPTGAAAAFGPELVERHLVTLSIAMEVGVLGWFVPLVAAIAAASRSARVERVRAHVVRLSGVALLAFAAHLLGAVIVRHLSHPWGS
jgi:threonine/homoserine/homoserine lactone efflux protein